MRWPNRNEAKRQARVERGRYKCAKCKHIFCNEQIRIDHIDPVVHARKGFQDWEVFINRLFCEVEGFQILCRNCHYHKTKQEDQLRKNYVKSA